MKYRCIASVSTKYTFVEDGGFYAMYLCAVARVSSKEQNETRQIKEFLSIGINIFIEKASGKSFNRKVYSQLLNA